MRRSSIVALCALALAPLAACGGNADNTDPAAEAAAPASAATLGQAIGDTAGMATIAAALKSSGLATVFDGAAPYTVLAPTDDAFGKLGDAGSQLRAPENSAALTAVLRDHILPGYLVPQDIEAALVRSDGKPVKLTTLGTGEVSFARDGSAISVTAADGTVGRIDGKALTARNGVAIPVDTVLKKLPDAAPAG